MDQEFDEMNFKAENDLEDQVNRNIVHIRVQNRKGRKHITTIAGISNEFDFEKMLKYWKKTLNCNGSLVLEGEETIVQLTGDQRQNIAKFLMEEGIVFNRDNIKIHGA